MPATCTGAPRRQHTPGRWRTLARAAIVLAGVVASGPATPARAQPAAGPRTLVHLTGGVAGLRRVLGPSLHASQVFVKAARRIDSPDENEAGTRRDLRAYMETVDAAQADASLAVDRVEKSLADQRADIAVGVRLTLGRIYLEQKNTDQAIATLKL